MDRRACARPGASPDLIESLVGGLEPVRPVRFRRLVALCLILGAAVVGLTTAMIGARPDLFERLRDPLFVAIAAALAAASAVCAAAAIRAAIPGREPPPRRALILWALPIVLAASVALISPWGSAWPGWSRLLMGCWSCVSLTALTAVLPWAVALAIVARLAPLHRARAGLLAGLSAFLLGALVTELHCPVSDAYHLAFAHYLPIAILSSLTCVLATLLLRDPAKDAAVG